MNQAQNIFAIETEIEIRRRASGAFDQIIESLSSSLALKPTVKQRRDSLDALAVLLDETRAEIKALQKQEEAIKTELKLRMSGNILDLPSALVLLDSVTRSGLDRDALLADQGVEFVARYTKMTTYDKLSVKRK